MSTHTTHVMAFEPSYRDTFGLIEPINPEYTRRIAESITFRDLEGAKVGDCLEIITEFAVAAACEAAKSEPNFTPRNKLVGSLFTVARLHGVHARHADTDANVMYRQLLERGGHFKQFLAS